MAECQQPRSPIFVGRRHAKLIDLTFALAIKKQPLGHGQSLTDRRYQIAFLCYAIQLYRYLQYGAVPRRVFGLSSLPPGLITD